MTGTTNIDQPFQPGETIEFCEEQFVVVANHGKTGTVREIGARGLTISMYYWQFQGEQCRRVETAIA